MTRQHHTPPARPAALELVAVALAGLNLRAALAALPALIGPIRRDTGLSLGQIGLLTALPVVCLGLAAPLATRLAARYGSERTIAAALGVLATGLGTRHWFATPTALYLTAVVVGLGVASVGAVLPGVVRERFARRAGTITGLYTGTMAAGASMAAGLAVPTETLLGSWRDALALWALPALAGMLAWLTLEHRRPDGPAPRRAPGAARRLPWRDRTAWMITAYQTTQSALAVSELAWIGPAYTDLHRSPRTAGLLAAGFAAAGVLATVVIPVLADRLPRRPLLLGALTSALAGTTLLALAPDLLPWGSVVLVGTGQTAAFAIGLVLLVDSTASSADTRALTAMTFLIAYPAAAAAPPALGALREATGAFTIPFLALTALNLAALTLARFLPAAIPPTRTPPSRAPAATVPDATVP